MSIWQSFLLQVLEVLPLLDGLDGDFLELVAVEQRVGLRVALLLDEVEQVDDLRILRELVLELEEAELEPLFLQEETDEVLELAWALKGL